MSFSYQRLAANALLTAVLLVTVTTAKSLSFTITNGQVVTTQQTLNANETGVIEAGGQLNTVGIAINNPAAQNNITVLNNGRISTTGFGGHGIFSISSTNPRIFNSGTISTIGNNAFGIFLNSSANPNITNIGTISTTGNSAFGFVSVFTTNGSFTNSGTISTTGISAHGIFSIFNANESITNIGRILTTGNGAHGVFLFGNTNTSFTNSGLIQVTGTGAIGVNMLGGTGSTLTNSGYIFAVGNANQAIVGSASNDTLNLLSGSQIIGSINLGGGTDVVNISGANTSSSLTILNAETINLNVPGVVNGNVVTTVDPTGQSVLGVALSTLTAAFHDVISQRMARTQIPLPPTQLASLELMPGMLLQERTSTAWSEVFGSYRTRGAEGTALAHTHDYVGFTGGYERAYQKGRLGLMAGYANANVSTKKVSIATDTNSFFGGVYGHLYLGQANLTVSLAGGYEDHDNVRTVIDNIAGAEAARSEFSSVFFSPSLTLSSAYPFAGRFEFRPSTTVVYTIAQYDNYQETGTTNSNLFVDDRIVQTLKGRVQLAVAMILNEASEFELRTGFTTRHTDHDDINANLAGSSFQFAAVGDNSVQGGFVGGNLRLHATDNLDVLVDVKYRGASGHESEITARAGAEYHF